MGKGSLFWFGRDPSLYFNYAQALSLDRGPRLKDMEHSYTVHIDNKIPYDVARVKLINQLFDIIFQHGNIKEPMWRDEYGQLKYYANAKVTRKTVVYIHF